MSKIITIPAARVKQGGLQLFATSLKVSDLLQPHFYSVEALDPIDPNNQGYQRLLDKNRSKRLANYITAGQDTNDAFLPTSIFMATDQNVDFDDKSNTITIDIDKIGPFSVVDGQHRVEGLRMAAEKDKRVLDFEVPVNIAVNLSKIAQMCHFLIVNTTQKSVDKGVEQRIYARLTKAFELEQVPNLPKWIKNVASRGEDEKALKYVDFLNEHPESPWKNKIHLANQERQGRILTQKTFVQFIKEFIIVANNPLASKSDDIQHGLFLNYWKAITSILAPEDSSVLFKYNGASLFCRFFIPFCQKMINQSDWTVPTMKKVLESTFENIEGEFDGVGHTEFWISGNKASTLNNGVLSTLNYEMQKALNFSNSNLEIIL